MDTGGRCITVHAPTGEILSQWLPALPRIPDRYLDCVVYLYPSAKDAEEGVRLGGSGFLVAAEVDGRQPGDMYFYVVTNKHVVERGSTTIRMKSKTGGNVVFETDERTWIYHPAGDDIAVTNVCFDPRYFTFSYIQTSNFITKEIVKEMSIGPGDEVFVVGRFINHEGKQQNLPTVRFGCVGQMPNEPVHQDDGFLQESFLVEAKSIGGYSGSPVFVFIPAASEREGVKGWVEEMKVLRSHGPWLLGVDWGHINDWTPVCDSAGHPVNKGDPFALQVRINTGLMGVVPAWKLYELLHDQRVVAASQTILDRFRGAQAAQPPTSTFD